MQKELEQLYNTVSKHSNYQVLSSLITDKLSIENIKTNSRYEIERLKYIKKHLETTGKDVLDIGGNTGFFTFESIKDNAKSVTYVEGNKEHAEFVREVARILDIDNLEVMNQYFDFINLGNQSYDVTYLLNVLHHIGDDFGDNKLNIIEAKKQILISLNNMAKITREMVFQLGFNWKGDRNICLFENGTKEELINYIKEGTSDYWDVESIGINTGSEYEELSSQNIDRIDELGEFRNRPLFIMKSKIKRK